MTEEKQLNSLKKSSNKVLSPQEDKYIYIFSLPSERELISWIKIMKRYVESIKEQNNSKSEFIKTHHRNRSNSM